jgi:L-ascorbate metabolism protein UlaG (beta-lactamase superfamily)
VNVTLVRHAALLLDSSLGRVLVDPMLRAAGTTPPIEDTANEPRDPLAELPTAPELIVARSAYRAIVGVRVPDDGDMIEL